MTSNSRENRPLPRTIDSVTRALQRLAPLELAADWDNVGLLVGDAAGRCERVMTCLTITSAVVAEAVERRADLVVAHHPLPFQAQRRITADSVYGRYLLSLISNGTAIYSAHTAFDSAERGINQQWADGLRLTQVAPLEPHAAMSKLGSGRWGHLEHPITAQRLASSAASFSRSSAVRIVGEPTSSISTVAISCGSGGSHLAAAIRAGCEAMVTGEANFHTCLEAEAAGITLVLVGHFASERFAMEWLAEWLQAEFPDCQAWASRNETDPLNSV